MINQQQDPVHFFRLVISVMYFALQVLDRESADWAGPGNIVWHENVKLSGARS